MAEQFSGALSIVWSLLSVVGAQKSDWRMVNGCYGHVPLIVDRLYTYPQVEGENTTFNVKRLEKKPAPERFLGKLSDSQKRLATHICLDCGYIYADR